MNNIKIKKQIKFKRKKISFLKKTKGGNVNLENTRDGDVAFLHSLKCFNEATSDEKKIKCIKDYFNHLVNS